MQHIPELNDWVEIDILDRLGETSTVITGRVVGVRADYFNPDSFGVLIHGLDSGWIVIDEQTIIRKVGEI